MNRGRFVMLQRLAYDQRVPQDERERVMRLFFPSHTPETLAEALGRANDMRRRGEGPAANALLTEIAENP